MTITTTTLLTAANCGRYEEDAAISQLAKGVMREVQPAILVETKFLPATDAKGARVKASMLGTSYSHTIGLDYALQTDQAHLKAALSMLTGWFEGERLICTGYTDTAKGFVFVFSHER